MRLYRSSFFTSIDTQKPYSHGIRLINCLNPNIALSLGLQVIGHYETQGMLTGANLYEKTRTFTAQGLQWSNINTPSSPDDKLTMIQLFVFLALDGFLFLLIALYVEQINPAGEGISQKPWFFLLVRRFFVCMQMQWTRFAAYILVSIACTTRSA